jgi:hypothetical protein
MNYKTLIAFLGKNQMKDWANPKSEWIIAKDIGAVEWREGFRSLKNLGKQSSFAPTVFAHTDNAQLNIRSDWGEETPTGWDSFIFYYNEELDMLILYNQYADVRGRMGEVLEHLSTLTMSEIEKLNNESFDAILNEL